VKKKKKKKKFIKKKKKKGGEMSNTQRIKVERLYPIEEKGSLKAFCDLLIADSFVIKGIKVVQGKKDLFVSMPQQQGRDGKWYDTCHPVTPEMRDDVQKCVLTEYSSVKSGSNK